MDCMFQHICHDLLLLENQIPWFVLECLYAITRKSYPHDPSLQILMLTVFTSQPPLAHSCKFYAGYLLDRNDHDDDEMILHILDLIRTSIVFPFKEFVPSDTKYKKCLWIKKKPNKKYGSEIPPAATLSQAGIKFESGLP
ncbi:hypothetical protein RchiOBHm_Chr4g0411031 [Rosa chinensis]|uniref:Uncharacterized protein n=1 Tax=Rosa chinensis TaxID=74649 RepID=A0A2P6QVI1_ROSCH|nr:hypothetical protein RchiOBHm_Chr4g0411031 [Rosa chinensis]